MDMHEITRSVDPVRQDVESVHFGELDKNEIQQVLRDPKTFVRTAGISVRDESEYKVTINRREDKHGGDVASKLAATPMAAARARILILHYPCCCGEIIILGW